MTRSPKDLIRYTASERVNHWMVAITFVLVALSGLSFFHPAFFPLTLLFGGGVWTRILHPYLSVLLILFFASLFMRFSALNRMTPADREWVKRVGQMVGDNNDRNMPAQGKFNGGQKLLFWAVSVCLLAMVLSGLVMWRAWFTFPVTLVRLCAVIHAAGAAVMVLLILVHVYAGIWTRGTIRAMVYGTVSRAWAKQHHETWYHQMVGGRS
jgi:formate dehydrogenase subunit gamma